MAARELTSATAVVTSWIFSYPTMKDWTKLVHYTHFVWNKLAKLSYIMSPEKGLRATYRCPASYRRQEITVIIEASNYLQSNVVIVKS